MRKLKQQHNEPDRVWRCTSCDLIHVAVRDRFVIPENGQADLRISHSGDVENLHSINSYTDMNAIELKRKRERLGWSQTELAEKIDVSRHTIINYENEKIQIPKTAQIALDKIFADNGL